MTSKYFIFLITTFFIIVTPIFAQESISNREQNLSNFQLAHKYYINRDFEKSIVYVRKVLEESTKSKDTVLLSVGYNQLGSIYREFSEFDKAIDFYKKALYYANKSGLDSLKLKVNNNLGIMYCFEKKQSNIGIDYLKKAFFYCKKIHNKRYSLVLSLNMTWAFFDQSNYKDGLTYLNYVNENFTDYGDKSITVLHQMVNGMFYSHIGNYSKAKNYFENAIQIGNKEGELNFVSYTHNEYAKMFFQIKDYKNAYLNVRKFEELEQKLYDENKLFLASKAGINAELDEYKRELVKIKSLKDSQVESLRKTRIIVGLFLVVLVVMLALIYTLIRNNTFRRKINKQLTKVNYNLKLAKDKAEEASLLKSQFVSTISHELRTPLYGVIGITNMLIDEHKDLAKSPHLSSLKFSARYLLTLVNDILQINKIEERRLVLENTTFNISDEIEMIINSLSFLAKSNKNKVFLDVDPNIPEYVIGDKMRFSQIIMNLTSNALKFTKKGKVNIFVKLMQKEGNLNHISFEIKDNGVGIAEEDQNKIFDKFVQIGRNDSDYQGTGLGLTIVKRLLNLFNSEIVIESEVGKGTIFSFILIFESDVEKTNTLINNYKVDLSTNQSLKVLVVEDNKINQLVTKKIMQKNKFKCKVVDDGYEALKILETETYDVILMDINMPIMNGFETTRNIRSKNITTPVIALTAFDKDEIAEEALSSGINDIIIKPFDQNKLFKAINLLMPTVNQKV